LTVQQVLIDPAVKYSEPCRRRLLVDEGQTFTFFNCRIKRSFPTEKHQYPRLFSIGFA
jgi:hypothetical protein